VTLDDVNGTKRFDVEAFRVSVMGRPGVPETPETDGRRNSTLFTVAPTVRFANSEPPLANLTPHHVPEVKGQGPLHRASWPVRLGACVEQAFGTGDMEALTALEAGGEATVAVALAVDAVVLSGPRRRTRRSAAAALGGSEAKAILAAPKLLVVVVLALLVASGECRGGGVPAGSAAYLSAPAPSCGRNHRNRRCPVKSWRRTMKGAPPSSSAPALALSGARFSFGSFRASRGSLGGWGCRPAADRILLPPEQALLGQQLQQQTQRHGRRYRTRGSIERRATVYAPPWEGISSDAGVADPEDSSDLYYSSSLEKDDDDNHHAALKSRICRTEASAAMLARLAVAFSPESRSLDIRDIEHVKC
jgi:hypothetical protein